MCPMPQMHSKVVWDLSLRCTVCTHMWLETVEAIPPGGAHFHCPRCDGRTVDVQAERERQVLTE